MYFHFSPSLGCFGWNNLTIKQPLVLSRGLWLSLCTCVCPCSKPDYRALVTNELSDHYYSWCNIICLQIRISLARLGTQSPQRPTHLLNMHSWRCASIWNPGGVHVMSRFSELAWQEGRVLHLDGCRCRSLLFVTIAFHQLYDVHMSIECEDFSHKRASGKMTPLANQLIIIPQTGCGTCCSHPGWARAQMKIKTAKKEGPSATLRKLKNLSTRRKNYRSWSESLWNKPAFKIKWLMFFFKKGLVGEGERLINYIICPFMPSCVKLSLPLPRILKPRFKNPDHCQEDCLAVIELVSNKSAIHNGPWAPPYRFPCIVWD